VNLIKPPKLHPGDKIATVSLSWGIAGEPDVRWRYDLAVSRIKEYFGLECVAAPNSMRGEKYLRESPEARAEDLMWAFAQPDIKGIIANIGGNDSIRLFPYIDYDIIRNHPKIFIGYSDIMNVHLMCLTAGLSTFYGVNLLPSFGEPQGVHPYTVKHFKNVLFNAREIGIIDPPDCFGCDAHDYKNKDKINTYNPCGKYELLQGQGIIRGRLLGGHTGIKDIEQTSLFAPFEENNGIILFVEDMVEYVSPDNFADFFIWLAKKDIMRNLKGLIIGRFNEYPENCDYKNALLKTIGELGLSSLPILYNLPFGHTSPICVLPYGAMAEIDCDNVTFNILESGVMN
jgi:muramoyltetrapeptide carboxypeptidase LdcA involved in peptidoglycan recycling